jgi:TonB family protein
MMALMLMVKYPASAIKDSMEGQVLIELEISEQGKVMSARVKRGVRADLDSAAVQAMRKADFKPALYQSKPVAVKVTVPIMFKLAK